MKAKILPILLLLSSCVFFVENRGAIASFDSNAAALGTLRLVNTADSVVTFSTFDSTFRIRSNSANVRDTVEVLYAWSSTKALARHINIVGLITYINLEISGFSIYRSNFYPFEENLSAFTPSGILYLN